MQDTWPGRFHSTCGAGNLVGTTTIASGWSRCVLTRTGLFVPRDRSNEQHKHRELMVKLMSEPAGSSLLMWVHTPTPTPPTKRSRVRFSRTLFTHRVKSTTSSAVFCMDLIMLLLTFNADHMIANLLRHLLIGYHFDQIVDRIDGRMDALEALDLLPYGQRVVQERLQVVRARGAAAAAAASSAAHFRESRWCCSIKCGRIRSVGRQGL